MDSGNTQQQLAHMAAQEENVYLQNVPPPVMIIIHAPKTYAVPQPIMTAIMNP
jgi:hypothetical protein